MKVSEIQTRVSPILRAHGVKRASVFGSVARGEDHLESDVDILVQLGQPMGLFAYMSLIRQIEESLGRKIDLVTENNLNKFVKPYVLPELKTIYEG